MAAVAGPMLAAKLVHGISPLAVQNAVPTLLRVFKVAPPYLPPGAALPPTTGQIWPRGSGQPH